MDHIHARRFQWLPFIISLLITLGIGITASYFTRPKIPGWYSTLHKPSFTPPNWAFPVAWTSIYIMIGTAAYLVWQRRERTVQYIGARAVYAVQLVLNFSWSIIFFGFHQIFMALIIIALLWMVIIANIYYFQKFSKAAGWLLVPYLLWVSFASALNLSIYILNK